MSNLPPSLQNRAYSNLIVSGNSTVESSSTAESASKSVSKRNAVGSWLERVFDPMGAEMRYNSSEAEKQREYEERMSNTAYQRAVADMQSAGLNPALMYSNSSSSSSTPVGSTSSVVGNRPSILNTVSTGLQLAGAISNYKRTLAEMNYSKSKLSKVGNVLGRSSDDSNTAMAIAKMVTLLAK